MTTTRSPVGHKARSPSERVHRCGICLEIIKKEKSAKHECYKRYCSNCAGNRETGHLCYMAPLTPERPSSDKVLYVFYDFETSQETRFLDTATVHVPKLVCVQQFCTRCEGEPDIGLDCERCGKWKHTFWEDPVVDLLRYLCQHQPLVNKIVAIAHNAKAFDLHFILNKAIELKWQPEHIMNG